MIARNQCKQYSKQNFIGEKSEHPYEDADSDKALI